MNTLNILSGIFAFVAAIFWLISALMIIPRGFHRNDDGNIRSIEPLRKFLEKQSIFSACAAFFAGLAAIFQFIIILFKN